MSIPVMYQDVYLLHFFILYPLFGIMTHFFSIFTSNIIWVIGYDSVITHLHMLIDQLLCAFRQGSHWHVPSATPVQLSWVGCIGDDETIAEEWLKEVQSRAILVWHHPDIYQEDQLGPSRFQSRLYWAPKFPDIPLMCQDQGTQEKVNLLWLALAVFELLWRH